MTHSSPLKPSKRPHSSAAPAAPTTPVPETPETTTDDPLEQDDQRQLDSEDIILDQMASEMADEQHLIFNDYFNNGGLELSIPQVSRLIAANNIFFIDGILARCVPTTVDLKKFKPITLNESKIDIVNMLADMLRLFISNKVTKNYKPVYYPSPPEAEAAEATAAAAAT